MTLYQRSDDGSRWDEKVTLSAALLGGSRTYLITWLVFSILTLVSLIGFLFRAYRINKAHVTREIRIIPKGILCANIASIATAFLSLITALLYIAEATVTRRFAIAAIVQFPIDISVSLVVYFTLCQIVQKYFDKIWTHSRKLSYISTAHNVILGILVVFSFVCFVLYAKGTVNTVNRDSSLTLATPQVQHVASTREVICLLALAEILVWSIIFCVKASPRWFKKRTGTIAFAVACASTILLQFTSTVVQVRYGSEAIPAPKYLNFTLCIFRFVGTVGMFAGMIVCCLYWPQESKSASWPGSRSLERLHSEQSLGVYPGGDSSQWPSDNLGVGSIPDERLPPYELTPVGVREQEYPREKF